jgi:transcriptional regulator with XRE-family HTH domain
VAHDREIVTPTAAIAKRIREVREKRRMTAKQLAERMTAAGIKWDRSIVANLEIGRRSLVTVEELLALAKVLQVAPVHLLVPPAAGDELYQVTPDAEAPASQVREWVRGYGLLPGDDRQLYLSEIPPGEFEEIAGVAFPTRQPWQLRQMQRDQPGEKSE